MAWPGLCHLYDGRMPTDHVELHEGSRIALLVPGSVQYVELVISLLSAGMFPVPLDPKLTTTERDRIFATVRPDLVVETQGTLEQMVANTPDRFRLAMPRARPMHCTSGTTISTVLPFGRAVAAKACSGSSRFMLRLSHHLRHSAKSWPVR